MAMLVQLHGQALVRVGYGHCVSPVQSRLDIDSISCRAEPKQRMQHLSSITGHVIAWTGPFITMKGAWHIGNAHAQARSSRQMFGLCVPIGLFRHRSQRYRL